MADKVAETVIKNFDKTVDNTLSQILNPGVVKGIVHLLLALYAVRLAPELPSYITDLFTNQYFRLFVFSLILWVARFSPSTALAIALAFMITVNYATNKPLWEFLENVEAEQQMAEQQMAEQQVEMQQHGASAVSGLSGVEEVLLQPIKGLVPSPANTPEGMVAPSSPDSGCYPVRSFDMSKVVGYDASL